MKYHDLDTIHDMHVEITNRCNAACPMCARNDFGGRTKPDLVLDEWSREDIDAIFDPRIVNLQNVMFCGTHGDPASAEHLLHAVETIKERHDATVEIYTNGSIRKPEWWADLGRIMQARKGERWHYRNNDLMVFSVDGLADTNHIYRRNTNFEHIMTSAEAYIAAGGIARWDFIVFRHNEHQVEEAEEMAAKMGFKQFRIRKTSRFDYSPDGPDKWRVKDRDGSIAYHLEPPGEKYRNPEGKTLAALTQEHGNIENYFDTTAISCLYKSQFRRIYVNAYAKVFPCCYISDDGYPHKNAIYRDTQAKIFERYGDVFNSLRHHDWGEILSHEWLAGKLVESWDTNLNGGRLMRCARTCGVGYKPITSQSSTSDIKPE
jgi:MoaA/NifB/PqqE/SkfB family radical SAM enzyme